MVTHTHTDNIRTSRSASQTINDVNLGEHVVRSVVVAVVDVVGGVHLAALAALVTGRLKHTVNVEKQMMRIAECLLQIRAPHSRPL